jgi:hypothetical protein
MNGRLVAWGGKRTDPTLVPGRQAQANLIGAYHSALHPFRHAAQDTAPQACIRQEQAQVRPDRNLLVVNEKQGVITAQAGGHVLILPRRKDAAPDLRWGRTRAACHDRAVTEAGAPPRRENPPGPSHGARMSSGSTTTT